MRRIWSQISGSHISAPVHKKPKTDIYYLIIRLPSSVAVTSFISIWTCALLLLSSVNAGADQMLSNDRWLLEWTMAEKDYRKSKRRIESDTYFDASQASLNGVALQIKEIHTRGKTSLTYWRKSYTVSLEEAHTFRSKDGPKQLKKFYLLSMSMDHGCFHNRLAFHCFEELGLFPLFYQYTELQINGQSEGIYLLVQRPADYALQEVNSPGILRRGSTDFVVKEKYAKGIAEADRKKYMASFAAIRRLCSKEKGAQLFESLQNHIDLEAYFSWLSVNYLLRNGDYTDELFYYVLPDRQEIKFGIIPWDFDDILASAPHEGNAARNYEFRNHLLFSSEDRLDRVIAKDPFVYGKYLEQLLVTYERLDPSVISTIFAQIKLELAPYMLDADILEISKHDLYPLDDWSTQEQILTGTEDYLKNRRHQTMRTATHQRQAQQ